MEMKMFINLPVNGTLEDISGEKEGENVVVEEGKERKRRRGRKGNKSEKKK